MGGMDSEPLLPENTTRFRRLPTQTSPMDLSLSASQMLVDGAEPGVGLRRLVLCSFVGSLIPCLILCICLAKSVPIPWLVAISVVLVLAVFFTILVLTLSKDFDRITGKHAFSLDEYLKRPAGKLERAYVAFIARGAGFDVSSSPTDMCALDYRLSPHIDYLKVMCNYKGGARTELDTAKSVVIGTLRMGFGHYRISYSAASWVAAMNWNVFLHDLLNIEAEEKSILVDNDNAYRAASKLVSEIGGPVEMVWGWLTTSQTNCRMQLRNFFNVAHKLRPLLNDLPKDMPLICTHCMVGLTAVSSGFTKVINLVVDNHAKWDIVVPGAINLVQGPKMYMDLLRIGVPEEHLRYAGHWIPKDLVDNIESDCRARIARVDAGMPMRLLVPIGGAGAQKKFLTEFVKQLKDDILAGNVELILNAGDHANIREAFEAVIKDTLGIATETVRTAEELQKFASHLHAVSSRERLEMDAKPKVTILSFAEYFLAVSATDVLTRCTDVLVCKPSEIAFYPIPKLHIRRVGDHEEASAVRAAELGDGTLEARQPKEAVEAVHSLRPVVLRHMNHCIMQNNRAGLYNGCKVAAELACSL